jgi:hypothetical protein
MIDSAPAQHRCAFCDRPIEVGTGYVARIDVFADPQLPPMSSEQIESANLNATMAELMAQMNGMSQEELQDSVHRRFEYRLCPLCHRSFLANPLGAPRRVPVGKN